ncbi:MAG: LysR family transcriptional regulator [Hyphomicrobiaceae bacterium]|nr:LysR family transcriptional regulator [Hyphomicrobiaceae bacterium]
MAIGFTHLRTFHAVAEHRGFTAAANALGIGQPTVTTQIKELEQRYSVELLLRRGRQVELTDAGLALLEITRRMIKLHEEADELLNSHGRLLRGQLRLAAVGPFHATEMIAAFRQRYPSVRVNVMLGNSEQILASLVELRADVAILAHGMDDPRMHSVFYRKHQVVVFVNHQHPWFHRDSVGYEELAGQPFVLRERGSTTRHAFESAMQASGLTIEPVLEIGSREGVWKAVEQGLGIGVVADFEFVPHPNLRTLRISGETILTEYRVACLQDRCNSAKIRAFLSVVEDMKAHIS